MKQPLWMIGSDKGALTGCMLSLILSYPELYFSSVSVSSSLLPAHEAGHSSGQSIASPQLPLQKNWANTRARKQQSSPPSAAVNERGCCCQVSCEFETAAERTHCALTTQSGTAAARLPGTTGSI